MLMLLIAGVASVDITSDNSTIADESYLYGYNDGLASAQADIDALQLYLMKLLLIQVEVPVSLFI